MSATLTTETIWDELGQTLRGYFARRLTDAHVVDDLTQETFLRIHRGLHGLSDADRMGPWVFSIARNVLADHRRGVRPYAKLDEAHAEPDAEPDGNTEQQIGRCLRAMLSSLRGEYREAIEAVEIDQITQAAYSEAAGLTLPGGKSRVQRGRQKLKEALLACCRFEFDRLGKPIAFESDCRCGTIAAKMSTAFVSTPAGMTK